MKTIGSKGWMQAPNNFLCFRHGRVGGWLAALCLLLAIPAGAAERQVVRGHVPEGGRGSVAIGQLPGTNHLHLAIGLPLRNRDVLTNLLQQIYDPTSTNFHRYLTPEQFTEAFGPTEQDYQAVIAYAKANGFTVTGTHPNRVLVDVEGTVAGIEKAFNVKMRVYPHPTEKRNFYAPDAEPSLDLSVPVAHISGLDDYAPPRPRLQVQPFGQQSSAAPNAGSGPFGTYMGNDFRAAYVPGTTLTGSGQTVGLLQFDGYSSNDIAYYMATNHMSSVMVTNVLLDGFSGLPTGNGGEVEVCLDIEMVLSMAPGVSAIYVYEAGPFGVWHDILNRMANDNIAKQLSCSWYIPGGAMDTVADGIFQQMALQGQSFYSASGDYDAFCGLIPFPGDTPYITEVGGTLLGTSGPGGPWTTEQTWNRYNGIGSGGGISTQYPIPTWQQGISMTGNFGSTTMRNVPDVALTADQVYVRADNIDQNVGGTSCAAPLWAGFTALMNQQAVSNGRPTVGFVNPAIYALGQSADYTATFHDITIGNNTNTSCGTTRFPAVTGYDLATGWGSPAGTLLINALAGPPDALQIAPLSGFTSSGSVGGPFSVTSQTLTLTNSGTNTFTWSLSNTSLWLNASLTSGTLAPGATANVNVSLNTVASNLVAATYSATLLFTNQNSGVGQGRAFTLTVLGAPVITSQPTSQSAFSGQSASFTVGVIGLPPLYYQWFFSGTNLPSGTNATLTLTSVATNQAGNYYVVVSNSLGSATSSVVTLTVLNGPVFLTGSYLYLPIQTNGVFLANNTGVKFNTNGTGGASGVDFWEPGTPVYNTVVGVGGVNYVNGSAPVVAGLSNMNVVNLSSGSLLRAMITGTVVPGLNFSRDVSFATNSKVIRIVDTLQNTGSTALANVVVLDTADPDQDSAAPINPTFNTLNDVVSVLQTNDMVVATGPSTGLSVGFGTESGLQIPSAIGFNNLNAYGMMTVVDPNGVSADIDINLVENYGTLAAGQSQTVVWFQVFGATKSEVMTNFALASPIDPLQIIPLTGFTSSGGVGGPFSIASQTMTLTNAGTNLLTWSLSNTSLWLNASLAGGALTSGASANVDVSLNTVASNLLAGTYSATLWFTNQSSGVGQGRTFALTVLGAPVITNQPISQTVLTGNTATFAVGVLGLPPLYYQWMFSGTNLPSGTNATLTLTGVTTNQSGNYYVVVSNSLGSATSSVVTLTVTTGPPVPIFLTGNYIYLPIQTNGVFLANNTGVKFNTNGTGGATGVDFWEPGTPVYNTVVGVAGVDHVNGSAPVVSGFNNVSIANLSSGSLLHALISGVVVPGLNFSRDISFSSNSKIIRIVDTLQNTGATPLSNIVVLDTADPDQDSAAPISPTFSTLNDVVSVIQTNDMVVATGPTTGVSVGFGTESSQRIPSAVGFNTLDAYSMMTVVDPGGALADIDINLVENYGTLAAGQSQSVVWYQVFGATKSEVLTNFSMVAGGEPLQITPAAGFSSVGGIGGPFSVTSQTLTLTNAGTNSLTWSLSNTSLWLNVSQTGGTLNPGGPAANVNVGLNTVASNLLAGTYSATLWFTNQNDGVGQAGTYTLTVLGAPVITNQPASQIVYSGQTAIFTVGVFGLPPFNYQWLFSGTNLPSGTNATLTLTGVTTNQSGNYYVVVSNSLGSVTSSVVSLTVIPSPTDWFTELFNSTIITNVLAFRTFTFTPDGSLNTYSVCSLPTLALPTDPTGGTMLAEGDDMYVPITLSGTNTVAIYNTRTNVLFIGSNGYLTMNLGDSSLSPTYASHFSLPRVSALYRDLNPGAGGSVSWKQLADRVAITYRGVPIFGSSTQTNTFQIELFFNGVIRISYLGLNTPNGLIGLSSGAGQPANFVPSDFSSYSCGPQPPLITAQPVNQAVIVGSNATFVVDAIGSLPLNYFWTRNGGLISGATNLSYTATNVQLTDSGSYFSCIVSNAYGLTNSQAATLTVLALPPVITQQPTNETVPLGYTALFSVTASGSAPLSYCWLRNGVSIPAATNSSYTLANVQTPDSGSLFSCVITNIAGSVTSSVALLKVDTTAINDQCSGAIVITNLGYTNAQFTLNATSTGDPVPDCVPGFGNGVWYQFTAPYSGQLEVDTFGSDYDTGLALYTGTCGALTEVGCNDDTGGLQSQVIIPVSAGIAYYILAGGYSGYTGHLVIHLALTAPPVIIAQPAGQTVIVGSNATFSIGATGGQPLSYSWMRNNAVIAGATNSSYTVTNVQYADSGSLFSCSVSNTYGVTNSLAGMLVVVSNSVPALITFDELPAPTGGIQITNGYYGLSWSNFYVLDAFDLTGLSGYKVGMMSVSNVAYNAFGSPASISRTNAFDLISGYFTAAWVNNLQIQVVGRSISGSVYSNNYVLNNTNCTFINFAYTGITNVLFISGGTQVAVDNLSVSTNSAPFLLITKVTTLPGGGIQINVTGSLGNVFRVLGSTNLVDWQTIATLTNVTGFLQFSDPGATNLNCRFYRLVTP